MNVNKLSKMKQDQSKEKKLSVLEIVKEKKHILFGSIQNNASTKKEKEEAWYEVLKKAQSMGLCSSNRQWSYARDNLFELWKSRTLAKRDKSKVLDKVDEAILNILGEHSLFVEALAQADSIATQRSQPQSGSITLKPETVSKNKNAAKRNSIDSLEDIKRDVLESELYANKLKIFKFEKELGLPPSKFTLEFRNPITKVDENTPDDGSEICNRLIPSIQK